MIRQEARAGGVIAGALLLALAAKAALRAGP